MNRRDLMGTALAFGAMQGAQAPRTFERLEDCVPDAGVVDWTPHVLHPVSYGYKDYGSSAPMPLRVYYPSHSLAPARSAPKPLLKMCNVRWPLVVFLHGRPPCDPGATDPSYHLMWQRYATVLAKSGYVVAVPIYEAPNPHVGDHTPMIRQVLSVIDWVRGAQIAPDSLHPGRATARAIGPLLPPRWEHADWVHPQATAVAGHSWGGSLAARVAQARPSISSLVSLGGELVEAITTAPCAKFLMAARGKAGVIAEEPGPLLWRAIPRPKYAAVFVGEHFDYIHIRPGSSCNEPRGGCTANRVLRDGAADLAALFIARFTPVGARAGAPVSLEPPNAPRSDNQKLFATDHLAGLAGLRSGCCMMLRWETAQGEGARQVGNGFCGDKPPLNF